MSPPSPIEPSPETLNEIRARLGRVCQNYPPDEFSRLVRQIATVQLKYERLRTEVFMEAARQLASESAAPRGERPPSRLDVIEGGEGPWS